MIEHLSVGRAGYFYARKKRLSDAAVNSLFRTLRSNAQQPSQNLFRAIRDKVDGLTYSAICFSFERSPSFLEPQAKAVERIFGFLLIVERGTLVAIFKSGLDLPSDFKSEYFNKVGNERVERAIARHDAIFEKLRLKNMSTSKLALRAKTLEARDLANAVPISSASRFVPQGYSVRRPDGSYSATPNTGRISVRADRAGYEEIVRWAGEIMDLLTAGAGVASPFIRNFARPLDLDTIPAGVHPTFVAPDIPTLASSLFDDEDRIRLVREDAGAHVELAKGEIDPILDELDRSFPIRTTRAAVQILNDAGADQIGELKFGKTRISLAGLAIPSISDIFVENAATPVGADPQRRLLARYLDREDLFTVLFSDLALAYIDGSLYRDEALLDGGANFLRRLQVVPELARATSEKGRFVAGQVEFDVTSVFRVVVDHIASDAEVLICDDLSDEWADFIGIDPRSNPAMISFYHAKHGNRSLSASAFHDSVGQAIKNLGRMVLPAEAMPAKYASWDANYRNAGAATSIARIMRGGGRAAVERSVEEASSTPDLVKRVYIVTSSLSRGQVEQAFADAAAGRPPTPHFVQLYWLLMSFFSACAEVGVIGYVACQP